MAQRAVEAEVLHVPEVFADVAEEMKTKIHILFRRGQRRTDHQNPAVHRW